jgi:mRNA interferase RelE/StbE
LRRSRLGLKIEGSRYARQERPKDVNIRIWIGSRFRITPTGQDLPPKSMFQVNFSNQSMSALNGLALEEQLKLVDQISSLTTEQLAHPREPLGKFNRGGITYYRLRAGEFRFYFEVHDDNLYSHYVLHRNTLTDFLFRTKLPISEEQIVEQHQSFWKYLESLREEH